MKAALEETDRRRAIQLAYNEEHGITAQTIVKGISDIADFLNQESKVPGKRGRKRRQRATEEPMTLTELEKTIAELEEEMLAAAEDLRFEYAARVRDEIRDLRREVREAYLQRGARLARRPGAPRPAPVGAAAADDAGDGVHRTRNDVPGRPRRPGRRARAPPRSASPVVAHLRRARAVRGRRLVADRGADAAVLPRRARARRSPRRPPPPSSPPDRAGDRHRRVDHHARVRRDHLAVPGRPLRRRRERERARPRLGPDRLDGGRRARRGRVAPHARRAAPRALRAPARRRDRRPAREPPPVPVGLAPRRPRRPRAGHRRVDGVLRAAGRLRPAPVDAAVLRAGRAQRRGPHARAPRGLRGHEPAGSRGHDRPGGPAQAQPRGHQHRVGRDLPARAAADRRPRPRARGAHRVEPAQPVRGASGLARAQLLRRRQHRGRRRRRAVHQPGGAAPPRPRGGRGAGHGLVGVRPSRRPADPAVVPGRARAGRLRGRRVPRPRRGPRLAARGDARDEPRRRRRRRGHRAEHARRERAQGAGAPPDARGQPRHADRAPEPHAAARPRRAGARPAPAQWRADRCDLHRPRRLQERQRHARARRGRRGAAGGRAAPGRVHPRVRHRDAAGRRRVRGARGRPHRREPRGRDRRADPGGARPAHGDRGAQRRAERQPRDRLRRRGARLGRRPAPRRRRARCTWPRTAGRVTTPSTSP